VLPAASTKEQIKKAALANSPVENSKSLYQDLNH
jgi:hypothetical protein